MTQEAARPSFEVGEQVGPYALGAAFEVGARQMSCFMTTGPQGQPALFWGMDPIEDAERRRERIEALRFLAYLRDPGISPILDTGVCTDGRRLFVVTERPTREALRPFDPEAHGAMRPASALRVMISLLETVESLQSQGVTVMSAMRPDLLFLTPDDRCVMLGWFEDHLQDRGDGLKDGAASLSRFICPPYMAPEVLFGDHPWVITPDSALFVAGVVMVELLRGRRFFPKDQRPMESLMEMHQSSLAPVLDGMNLPSRPRRLLTRALSSEPSERDGVAAMLGELRECLKETTRPDPTRQPWEIDDWGEGGWFERGPYILANPKGSMYVERGNLVGNHGDADGDGAGAEGGDGERSWVGRLWDRLRGR